ncbi:MAG: thioredoxin family protein [Elainellaceae cyanobacterium]
MAVTEVSDPQFQQEVVDASQQQPVLVYFWAPWCGPCRLMSPVMNSLSDRYEALKVAKMEVDPNPQSVATCGVEGVPALILFREGEKVEAIEGAISKDRLTNFLDSHLSATA